MSLVRSDSLIEPARHPAHRRSILLACSLLCALSLTACGDDGDASEPAAATTDPVAAQPPATEPNDPPEAPEPAGDRKGRSDSRDGPPRESPRGPGEDAPAADGDGVPRSPTADPVPAECPAGITESQCVELAESIAAAGKPKRSDDDPPCPPSLDREGCLALGEAVSSAKPPREPSGDEPSCPASLSPAQCEEFGLAYQESQGP